MKFLGSIEVQLDEVACLGVFEMCKCPSMGEFTREGFVEGWKNARYVSALHKPKKKKKKKVKKTMYF